MRAAATGRRPERRGMSARGNWRTTGACLMAGLAGGLLLLACAPAARHDLLTFFFDGVPSGKEVPSTAAIGPTSARIQRPPMAVAYPIRLVPTPPPIVSVHKPFAERQCTECHQISRGMEPLANDERLCDKCHGEQRRRQGWNHGPINLGTCIPCHRAHDSAYPHLLDRPIPQLCLFCHVGALENMPAYHQVAELNDCTKCHDPHRMY
ncbi:MAG: hypothetical protein M1457_05670 [bacterium]|nr:hypothetical protein [bacterium]